MASNRAVVYVGPGKVEVRSIDFPKLVDPRGKRSDHGVILKVVSTNVCGSDQHMVRDRGGQLEFQVCTSPMIRARKTTRPAPGVSVCGSDSVGLSPAGDDFRCEQLQCASA